MSLRGVIILYRPDDIYTNKFKYYDEVDSMDELGLIMIYRAYIQGTAHECALKLAEDDLFNVNNTEEIKFNSLLRCTRKFLRESIDELFDPHQIDIVKYRIYTSTYFIFVSNITQDTVISPMEEARDILYIRACALSHLSSFNQTVERVDPPFI